MHFLTSADDFPRREAAFAAIPVDEVRRAPAGWQPPLALTTLAAPCHVSGRGTYDGRCLRRLSCIPLAEGTTWTMSRGDLPESLPIAADIANVRSANRSITLGAGAMENCFRMTEHIVAHRLGLGIDCLTVCSDSWDPPLFENGSIPLLEALRDAGQTEIPGTSAVFWTVKEPVVFPGPHGSFLRFDPADNGSRLLSLDVAIDFPTVLGRQRIQFDLTPAIFTYGAQARTNCSARDYFLMRTIGKLWGDFRHTGYSFQNILVAGKKTYRTEPNPAFWSNGKCLEAVWHRACLDLVAALSLFAPGRLAGKITSYKAGHALDCRFLALLVKRHLLAPVEK